MKITAYLKPTCGWSGGVRDVFAHYGLEYEEKLITLAQDRLLKIEGIQIYSPRANKGPTITFNIDNIHSYDLTKVLDEMKVAIRSGHHCAQPLMNTLGISSSNRISLSFYNTEDEVDRFISTLNKAIEILI